MTIRSAMQYELVRKLGAGGMAEIFLARQWSEGGLGREVTLKRLFAEFVEHPEAVERFHMEARLLSALCHPNIPQALDFGRDSDTYFMVLEYVDGHDLGELWRAGARHHQPMPLGVAIGIVMQIAEALHHTHERLDETGLPMRIVHRDVTPHNVMITHDGVAKLMDFGVATSTVRPGRSDGSLIGTVGYMAPEQIRGQRLDRRADVFSLGVLLYELTTGTRAYRGAKTEILTAAVETDVTPPSIRVPAYPADLQAIVVSTLQRQRRNRMSSAAHLAASLEQFAQNHGLRTGPRVIARYVGVVLPAIGSAPPPDPMQAIIAPSEAPDSVEEVLGSESVELLDDSIIEMNLFEPWEESRITGGVLGEEIDSGQTPVVLLDKPKEPERDGSGAYLADLEKRLGDDDDDSAEKA